MVLPSAFLQKGLLGGEQEVLLTSDFAKSVLPPAKPTPNAEIKVVKPTSRSPLTQDHTYFQKEINSTKKSKKRVCGNSKVSLNVSDKVVMMQNGKSVGTGVVADGKILHGHTIPDGYVKVVIDYVKPNIMPTFSSAFDDSESLTAGQFVQWPECELNKM